MMTLRMGDGISMAPIPPFAWVSPYAPDDRRGGWKSMQYHLLRALEGRLGPAGRIAPVEVPEQVAAKWWSRLQKRLHVPRRYALYSESRLQQFARAVEARLPREAKAPAVFFGALPFVRCRPAQPYYIYTDGAFFIHYWEYNADHSHARSDIDRICQAEAEFMNRAAGVWCSSQWAAERIAREYDIPQARVRFVGTGPGDVPPPAEPVRYENFLVMITADFERKQGRLAVEAVQAARQLGVELSIKFIGAQPPADVLALPWVEWCSWLDLTKEEDRARFADVMSRAGAQILLSRADLTPLAIPEAATYSKATLATAVGGIPEMIEDESTGWLVNVKPTALELGSLLSRLFARPDQLRAAGVAANQAAQKKWNWQTVAGEALALAI